MDLTTKFVCLFNYLSEKINPEFILAWMSEANNLSEEKKKLYNALVYYAPKSIKTKLKSYEKDTEDKSIEEITKYDEKIWEEILHLSNTHKAKDYVMKDVFFKNQIICYKSLVVKCK